MVFHYNFKGVSNNKENLRVIVLANWIFKTSYIQYVTIISNWLLDKSWIVFALFGNQIRWVCIESKTPATRIQLYRYICTARLLTPVTCLINEQAREQQPKLASGANLENACLRYKTSFSDQFFLFISLIHFFPVQVIPVHSCCTTSSTENK